MKRRDKYRRKLRRHMRRNGNSATAVYLRTKYNQLRNKCVQMLRKAKRENIRTAVTREIERGMNPRKLIKRLKQNAIATIPSTLLVGSSYITGPDRAIAMNEYFTTCANFYPKYNRRNPGGYKKHQSSSRTLFRIQRSG